MRLITTDVHVSTCSVNVNVSVHVNCHSDTCVFIFWSVWCSVFSVLSVCASTTPEWFDADRAADTLCRCRPWLLRSQQSCVYLLQRHHCVGSVVLVHVAKVKSAVGVV